MTAARARTPAAEPLERVRALCLSLPESHEQDRGRPAIWCDCTPFEQDLLLRADPRRFFKPPYVGPGGWIGVYLDRRP